MEDNMEIPLKTKKSSYDLAIPLLGLYPEETKTEKRDMYPIVHCSTIYNSQNMEAN